MAYRGNDDVGVAEDGRQVGGLGVAIRHRCIAFQQHPDRFAQDGAVAYDDGVLTGGTER